MRTRNLCMVISVLLFFVSSVGVAATFSADNIPLPEHPRPDFERVEWQNLNGPWQFCFDNDDKGKNEGWSKGNMTFPETIMVPFPWGSKLSGLKSQADIGWYKRSIVVSEHWQDRKVFLVVGACDWHTTAWLDGNLLGSYQGGYTPFEFDLTPYVKTGKEHTLVLRVDDLPHQFKLNGKQGYGEAKGIWQTAYLEARADVSIKTLHFTPDIDKSKVTVKAILSDSAPSKMTLSINPASENIPLKKETKTISKGDSEIVFDIKLKNQRLWSLEDPFLYEVEGILEGKKTGTDVVKTYFGMRKIGVVNLPGTEIPYIALNNKPIYLQMCLDQSYHPEGFYTFPSDDFMRDEILRSRRIGLNGNRVHIKVEVPRKLYWADKLGVLIMADVPNSWGSPDADARAETETCLRGMIERDYNHPSIFSWINFNETWGLRTRGEGYKPETQEWVKSIYYLTKELDPTRLVEDNSTNNLDHVVTDINSWHAYLPGHRWRGLLDLYSELTYPGSQWNFLDGYKQGNQPMINSECGNVWGYESDAGGAAAGDMDWSWDYHMMINEFRRHPKLAGWLYTEHHDVINEWNGYYRYDRSDKHTGIPELVNGMTLNDMHSLFYIAVDREMCKDVKPGATVDVPLYASFLTDEDVGSELKIKAELYGWDVFGRREVYSQTDTSIDYIPWMTKELEPLEITMPEKSCVAVLAVTLEDATGNALHRNFTTFLVADGNSPREENLEDMKVIRFAPDTFKDAQWSYKQWNVIDGLKVNGSGSGFFEYSLPWPSDLDVSDIAEASMMLEVSAKRLNGKDAKGLSLDREGADLFQGQGSKDPSSSPNSYPMTGENKFPSSLIVNVAGTVVDTVDLPDDPADHRGILSWHSQEVNNPRKYGHEGATSFRDFKGGILHEAGSYGYLVNVRIPGSVLKKAKAAGEIRIRLESDDTLSGGIAIYGERFGRYPLDPTLLFALKN